MLYCFYVCRAEFFLGSKGRRAGDRLCSSEATIVARCGLYTCLPSYVVQKNTVEIVKQLPVASVAKQFLFGAEHVSVVIRWVDISTTVLAC